MADPRRLIAIVLLLAAAAARAAGPCDEGRGQTGLALAPGPDGGLVIESVDPGSAAAASGLAAGDDVVQVNAVLARGCGDWARAVRDARRERKAILLLVRRNGNDVPLAVAAGIWTRAVAAAPPPPAEAPSVRRLIASAPPPLPEDTTVTVDEVTRGLGALAAAERPSSRLETYRHDLLTVERRIETLAVRHAVPADVLDGLRTVAGYYEAAAVAWASEDAERERRGQPRHIPLREGATVPFFEDSEVADAIGRYPFLRETVVREPETGRVAESAGAWRPQQARTLLWQRGREELARLTAWLAASDR